MGLSISHSLKDAYCVHGPGLVGQWIQGWKGHLTICYPWAAQEEGPALGFVGTLIINSGSIMLGSGDIYVWGIPTVLRLPEHVFKVFPRASARRR